MLSIRLSILSGRGGMASLAWGIAFIVALSAAHSTAQEKPSGPAAKADGQVSAAEDDRDPSVPPSTKDATKDAEPRTDGAAPEPCVTDQPSKGPCTDKDKIPRFVVNSPFDSSKPLALKKVEQSFL